MKRTSTKLATRTLDPVKLRKVTGGRGTYCGSELHCDCGYVWVPCPTDNGMGLDFSSYAMCPSCCSSL